MQSHLQKLPPMAANLRRDDDERRRERTTDDDRRRETTTRRKPCKHSSDPQTPNYKREPFATHPGKTLNPNRRRDKPSARCSRLLHSPYSNTNFLRSYLRGPLPPPLLIGEPIWTLRSYLRGPLRPTRLIGQPLRARAQHRIAFNSPLRAQECLEQPFVAQDCL